MEMLAPALQFLKTSCGPKEKVFLFSQKQMIEQFRLAGEAIGCGVLRPELYQLRHSGPSHDLAVGHRRLEEVKLRGRWHSDKSVRRYAKEGRVADQLQRIGEHGQQLVLDAADTIELLEEFVAADMAGTMRAGGAAGL